MKRSEIVVTLIAALFGALPVIAAALPPELSKAAKEYDRATITSDIPMLEQLFAEDYVLVNSDASVEDKQQAIADFRTPGFRIDPYVVTQPVQTAWSDGAVIGGVVHLGWMQDGKHQQRWIRIAHVWAKRESGWQMIYTQVTRVAR